MRPLSSSLVTLAMFGMRCVLGFALAGVSAALAAQTPPLLPISVEYTDTLNLPTEIVSTRPLGDGDMLAVLKQRTETRRFWLTRLSSDGVIWHRGFARAVGHALHASGASVFVVEDGTVYGLDADGTRRAEVLAYPAGFSSELRVPSIAAGPQGRVGYVRDLAYCEVFESAAEACVAVPGLPNDKEATIEVDVAGAWLYYRTGPQGARSRLARFDRTTGTLQVWPFDQEEQTGILLAANEQAAWVNLTISATGGSQQRLFRVSSSGMAERAGPANAYRFRHAILSDGSLLSVRAHEGGNVVDRISVDLTAVSSEPLPAGFRSIHAFADDHSSVLTDPPPELHGLNFAHQYVRLNPDLSTGVVEQIPEAFSNWLTHDVSYSQGRVVVVTRPGSGSASAQLAHVFVYANQGALVLSRSLDVLPASMNLGSRDALVPDPLGLAVIGSTQRELSGRRMNAAWVGLADPGGSIALRYTGPVASYERLRYGEFVGDRLRVMSEWSPDGVFFEGTPRRPRLHMVDFLQGEQPVIDTIAPQYRNRVEIFDAFSSQGRWFGAFRATSFSSAPELAEYLFVGEYADNGALAWGRVYQGGERFSPRLARFGNTLVSSHSWLENPTDPQARWVCVVEGLDLQGNLLWTRTESEVGSNVFCRVGAQSGSSFLQTAVVRAPAGPAIRLLSIDAGGNVTRANEVVPAGGAATSPNLVLSTSSGWRVISRVSDAVVNRVDVLALDSNLQPLWTQTLDTGEPHGVPAALVNDGDILHLALVAGGRGRSTLWRWELAADGAITVLNRRVSNEHGARADSLSGADLSAALVPHGTDGSLVGATLLSASTANKIVLMSQPDAVFDDGFE